MAASVTPIPIDLSPESSPEVSPREDSLTTPRSEASPRTSPQVSPRGISPRGLASPRRRPALPVGHVDEDLQRMSQTQLENELEKLNAKLGATATRQLELEAVERQLQEDITRITNSIESGAEQQVELAEEVESLAVKRNQLKEECKQEREQLERLKDERQTLSKEFRDTKASYEDAVWKRVENLDVNFRLTKAIEVDKRKLKELASAREHLSRIIERLKVTKQSTVEKLVEARQMAQFAAEVQQRVLGIKQALRIQSVQRADLLNDLHQRTRALQVKVSASTHAPDVLLESFAKLSLLKADMLRQVDATKALHTLVCKEIKAIQTTLVESQRANQLQVQQVETILRERSDLLRDFQRLNRQLVQAGTNFRGRHVRAEGVEHLRKILEALKKALGELKRFVREDQSSMSPEAVFAKAQLEYEQQKKLQASINQTGAQLHARIDTLMNQLEETHASNSIMREMIENRAQRRMLMEETLHNKIRELRNTRA
mmetsp:Transcript_23869/g.59707  ORF Transcript_23869/g.59707 Transcript_23869/m.59707 type:complete len:489 (-) Transcript_23869:65-1531(-)